MSPYRSSALLAVAALALGATVVPAAAFADDATPPASTTTTTLSIDQLRQELAAAETASAQAVTDQGGWSLDGTDVENGGDAQTVHAAYDGGTGILTESGVGTIVEVQNQGSYFSRALFAAEMPGVRTALKAIAQPDATWIFQQDRSLSLLTGDGMTASLSPAGELRSLADPKASFGADPTRTVAEDGTTTYQFTITLPDDAADSGDTTLTIAPDGTLASMDTAGSADVSSVLFAYAPQTTIDLPTTGVVSLDRLMQGMMLATLPAETRSIATRTATQVTKVAYGHPVKARTIRSAVAVLVRRDNGAVGVKAFATHRIAGGVRIVGTNPYTRARTAYTVTAAGKKAVARKA